jgi:hypothetical protein
MEQENQKINWELIGKAISHYTENNYSYLEVPWLVDNEDIRVTYNGDVNYFENDSRILVGSAEQSFVHLIKNGTMPFGKHVACTPCFRKEKILDEIHKEYFVKVELINFVEPSMHNRYHLEELMSECIYDAYNFFIKHISKCTIKVLQIETDYDILINDIEVGSYGIRYHKDFAWIYGTGLAEPRFSTSLIKTISTNTTPYVETPNISV